MSIVTRAVGRIVSHIASNVRDTNAAADVGVNLAETDISEEDALKRFQEEAQSYHGEEASASDLEAFSDTAYFEFLHSRGLM